MGALVALALASVPLGLWLDHRTGALPATLVLIGVLIPSLRPLAGLFGPLAGQPRALLFDDSGRFWVELAGHPRRSVEVRGSSLVRGPWLVLRLSSETGRFSVLIERWRAPASEHAALLRALRRRAASPGGPRHALRSLLERGEPGP